LPKTITKPVEVYGKPSAMISNSSACDKVAMTFTAVAQPNSATISNWFWDFNNSINSIEGSGQSTNNTFSSAGSHTVGLVTESTPGGCRDTIKK